MSASTKPQPVYGIRIRDAEATAGTEWQRGKQFRRDPNDPTGRRWVYWRDTWQHRSTADKRLEQYREAGFVGHVFEIQPKVAYPNRTHYSANFTREELNCHGSECNGRNPPAEIQQNLVELCRTGLEPLRHELGDVLGILSGYRCRVHNDNVGGAELSMHMSGKAADPIVPPGGQARFDAAAARVPTFKNGGRGKYPNGGRHVDQGPKRTW